MKVEIANAFSQGTNEPRGIKEPGLEPGLWARLQLDRRWGKHTKGLFLRDLVRPADTG